MKKSNIIMLGTLLLSSFAMFSCKGNETSSNSFISSSISENLNNPEYSIKVTSLSGKPLKEVDLYIYDGTNLVKIIKTDDLGNAKTRLEDKDYSVELANLPSGYFVEKDINLVKGTQEYTFKVSSSVIEDTAPSGTFYQIGDLVYDFSVNTSDGDTFKLSEAIEEYDAVMINFWYRTCIGVMKNFRLWKKLIKIIKMILALLH